MRLSLNTTAPLFRQIDVFERMTDLKEYQGRKILLAFFRHAGCPFCNLRVHALTKENEKLKELGLDMIFVFESLRRVILRSSFHEEISPIPLIADPERTLYDMYGLEKSTVKSTISHLLSYVPTAIKAFQEKVPNHYMAGNESFSTLPAEFLIDETGVIRELYYSPSLTDRMDIQHIYDFAEKKSSVTI